MKSRLPQISDEELAQISDEELAQRVQDGKTGMEQATEELCHRYMEKLSQYAKSRDCRTDVAEDTAIEVLESFFEVLIESSERIENVSAWLYDALKKKTIDRKRRREVRKGHVSKDSETIPQLENHLDDADIRPDDTDVAAILREEREWLKEALSELPFRERQVTELDLAFKLPPQGRKDLNLPSTQEIYGWRNHDKTRARVIARHLGISKSSVTSARSRAQKKLKKWYKEEMRGVGTKQP